MKDVLTNLNLMDTFACFGIDRRHSFWKSLAFKNLIGKSSDSVQLSLFDENSKIESATNIFNPLTDLEKAIIDYRILGYSLQGSLMTQLRLEVPHLPTVTSKGLKYVKRNQTICCAGIFVSRSKAASSERIWIHYFRR